MAFYLDIESRTLDNSNYRKVIYTDENIQIVLMNLQEGEDIPSEVHPTTTQFIKVEGGFGEAIVDGQKYVISYGDSITIPPNTRHHIRNLSSQPLTLYTIYSPPEHAPHLIQESP